MPRPRTSSDTLAGAAELLLMNMPDENPERTIPRLIELMSAHNPIARKYAAASLLHHTGRYPDFDLAPFRSELVVYLDDADHWVRFYVASTLVREKLGGPEVLPALRPALTTPIQ